jgi:hypothetical protein
MATARGSVVVVLLAVACRPNGGDGHDSTRIHVARMTGRAGAVDVLRGGSVDWSRAGDTTDLYEDDRLRTFKSAWAQLAFDEGSTLRVDEESLITLGSGVLVERGSVAGLLQQGLKVQTPAAEAESVAPRDIVFR